MCKQLAIAIVGATLVAAFASTSFAQLGGRGIARQAVTGAAGTGTCAGMTGTGTTTTSGLTGFVPQSNLQLQQALALQGYSQPTLAQQQQFLYQQAMMRQAMMQQAYMQQLDAEQQAAASRPLTYSQRQAAAVAARKARAVLARELKRRGPTSSSSIAAN